MHQSERGARGTDTRVGTVADTARIFVVDASAANRARACALIERHADLRAVGGGDGSAGTLAAMIDAVPHVCLVGNRLVDSRVPAFLRAVHEQLPATRCVRLPDIPSPPSGSSRSALDRFHDRVTAEFVDDLRVAAGREPTTATPRDRPSGFWLTSRELEVLERVRAGLSNPDIAHDLGLSNKTIRNTVVTMLAKLGTDRAGETRRGLEGSADEPSPG